MGEPIANAPPSMPMPKKAMTQTMGRLGKIRLRPSKRDFFSSMEDEMCSTSKIGRAPASLRSNYRPGSKLALRCSAGLGLTTAASAAASLRSVRTGNLRGGNDARRKTPKTIFPPRLGIGQKPPDSHIPTASTTASTSFSYKLSRSPPHRTR